VTSSFLIIELHQIHIYCRDHAWFRFEPHSWQNSEWSLWNLNPQSEQNIALPPPPFADTCVGEVDGDDGDGNFPFFAPGAATTAFFVAGLGDFTGITPPGDKGGLLDFATIAAPTDDAGGDDNASARFGGGFGLFTVVAHFGICLSPASNANRRPQ